MNSIFIKKIGPYITYPLSIIINQSLSAGIVPDRLKIAKIIPLFKKKDDSIFDNYRPIALLPVVSKIMEKIVHKQICNYLISNNLLFESQHGFRENHSTETAVIELVDYLKFHIDKQHIPISLFLDLSKAFDTIDFDIMLLKLRYLGINGAALEWFNSYLRNRKQYVVYNNAKSDYLETKTGVPQGSVLGPLLFLIYVNDLNNVSPLFKIICFADDSTIIFSLCFTKSNCIFCNNRNKITTEQMNKELEKIYNWFCINKLSINPDKTKYILFKNKQRLIHNTDIPQLKLNGILLEKVSNFLYLGIYLDDDLSWTSHVNRTANKISKSNGILRRLKHTLPQSILKTLYSTLINPHLNYGILVWGFKIDRIAKLQKQSMRIITHSYFLAHSGNLFNQLGILKVEDIFALKQMIFYKKFLNGHLPLSIANVLSLQNINLRLCHSSFFLKPPDRVNT